MRLGGFAFKYLLMRAQRFVRGMSNQLVFGKYLGHNKQFQNRMRSK